MPPPHVTSCLGMILPASVGSLLTGTSGSVWCFLFYQRRSLHWGKGKKNKHNLEDASEIKQWCHKKIHLMDFFSRFQITLYSFGYMLNLILAFHTQLMASRCSGEIFKTQPLDGALGTANWLRIPGSCIETGQWIKSQWKSISLKIRSDIKPREAWSMTGWKSWFMWETKQQKWVTNS